MVGMKSGVQMDYWREFFRSANADIFEIIQRAIMLAASDCPKEFKVRRDHIAQILFSCRLIKCSGCDKEVLALPVDDQQHHHHHHHGDDDDEVVKYKSELGDANGNCSKESSKVINSSRNDEIDDDVDNEDDDDHHHHDVEVNGSNTQVSNYSYEDAEALTDEIEQESQTFDEVLRIKEIVDNSPDESASVLCNSLRKLQLMSISVDTLKETEIGKSVNVLRKHASKDVRQLARSLIEVWKYMVDEWVKATTKITVSENTPESTNPSVDEEEEEEEGLPSPPLDDLAFLNPHSMSLELSEKFFDGVDDYGNPQLNENHGNRKPPVEKQNVTKWKPQKPLNRPTMVPKQTVVKPCKPPVVDSTPRRRMNPNMDQKSENLEKTTLSKRPVTPQQRRPPSSDGEIVQDKLEATKRKLQIRYQQAEQAKRQRTIQVMELHDLPKQGVAPKHQHARPGNNHPRHWANGRF